MFARDLGSEVLNSKKQTNKQNPEILKLNTSPNQSGNEEKIPGWGVGWTGR